MQSQEAVSRQHDISLVVPTYNRADLLGATIDAALAQTKPFAQIVVVDNGSTDDTRKLLESYGNNVAAIYTASHGVQAARNVGVKACETPLVAFCDSDDLLEPDYVIAMQHAFASSMRLDALYVNFVNFSSEATSADKLSLAPDLWLGRHQETDGCLHDISDLPLRTLKFQPLFPSGLVVRKPVFVDLEGFDPRFRGIGAEDWEFALRLTERARVGIHKRPLVRIRRHDGNDSRSSSHMSAGEAQILRHALNHHRWPVGHEAAIEAEIQQRLLQAYEGHFADGSFRQALETSPDWKKIHANPRVRIKRAMLALPEPMRTWLWQLLCRP